MLNKLTKVLNIKSFKAHSVRYCINFSTIISFMRQKNKEFPIKLSVPIFTRTTQADKL